jgi:DNA-binding SARP family transcriptional activator
MGPQRASESLRGGPQAATGRFRGKDVAADAAAVPPRAVITHHRPPLTSTNGRAVELRLVNGFEVLRNRRPVPLPLTAQRLVAFLAFQERPVQRVYVAGKLWMDTDEARASGSLRSAIWRVKKADVALIRTPDTRLELDQGVHVDLAAAARLARALISGASHAAMEDLDALRGEILPDWYDDWLLMEREVHRQLRLHALEALAARLADAGRYGEATDAALSAIACEPLRESAHRTLVHVYVAEGNLSEALRHVELYRELVSRLGLAPSPQFEELTGGLTAH